MAEPELASEQCTDRQVHSGNDTLKQNAVRCANLLCIH